MNYYTNPYNLGIYSKYDYLCTQFIRIIKFDIFNLILERCFSILFSIKFIKFYINFIKAVFLQKIKRFLCVFNNYLIKNN